MCYDRRQLGKNTSNGVKLVIDDIDTGGVYNTRSAACVSGDYDVLTRTASRYDGIGQRCKLVIHDTISVGVCNNRSAACVRATTIYSTGTNFLITRTG